ncbi:MAG TPA: PspC domain-containing protein [Acidobacteriaceae bacterium]|nr:PspC domain-containing protein [Acidobacteriaceae bacterium]
MYCRQCGKPLAEGANFCSSCGSPANANVFTASPLNTMYRPRAQRMIAGVCAAFHLRYGWDLTATRILAVVLAIFLFPFTEIAYLVGWVVIPEEVPFMPPAPVVNVTNQDAQPR